jgi:4-oxalocrotonate tautomerase
VLIAKFGHFRFDSAARNPKSAIRRELSMPIVQISMIAGRTPEKKEQLIKKVTDAIVEVLQIPAGRVQIIIHDVPNENIGDGGVPLSKTIK